LAKNEKCAKFLIENGLQNALDRLRLPFGLTASRLGIFFFFVGRLTGWLDNARFSHVCFFFCFSLFFFGPSEVCVYVSRGDPEGRTRAGLFV